MGAKLFGPEPRVMKFEYDFAKLGGAIGTIKLGDLPDNFLITKCVAVVETALSAGGTFVIGEDGGGNASGYWTDLTASVTGAVVPGTGALVFTAAATPAEIGNEAVRRVPAATDGVLVTIAGSAKTAGKIVLYFLGCQS